MNKKKSDYSKDKKAQMQIGFGMIFSVILIVVFIVFAVYGIMKFMGTVNLVKVASFKEDIQGDINSVWRSNSESRPVSYIIPKSIKQVCFTVNPDENMYFVPSDYDGALLENIDIVKTVTSPGGANRKLCIDAKAGKVSMVLVKPSNENLVTITK